MMGGGEKLFNLRQRLMRAPRVLGPALGPGGKIGSQRTRRWRELDSNLYGGFSCQVIIFGLLAVLCS
jgi:hypothetical protein